MSDTNERSVASAGSVAERPLGDPEIAVEILKLRVAELEQAIRRLAEQDATLSVCDGSVTVTMDATLTDAEITEIELLARQAEQDADAASFVLDIDRARACERRAAILRGLLERTTEGGEP